MYVYHSPVKLKRKRLRGLLRFSFRLRRELKRGDWASLVKVD